MIASALSARVQPLVCQFVCQFAPSDIEMRAFVKDSGEPHFRQLEPCGPRVAAGGRHQSSRVTTETARLVSRLDSKGVRSMAGLDWPECPAVGASARLASGECSRLLQSDGVVLRVLDQRQISIDSCDLDAYSREADDRALI